MKQAHAVFFTANNMQACVKPVPVNVTYREFGVRGIYALIR